MKAFDTHLFKRILEYTKPYKWRYYGVIVWAILLSVFAALRPYLLKDIIDDYVLPKKINGFIFFVLNSHLLSVKNLLNFFFLRNTIY